LSISAVVVNYRSVDHLMGCVASLGADGITDVVVVDNDSVDGCRERLAAEAPSVRYLATEHNIGYGAAANRGVPLTEGSAVLVCNPDLVVGPGSRAALMATFATDARIGAVGPRIDRTDGTRYPSARAFPSLIDAAGHGFVGLISAANPFSRRYLRTDAAAPGPVDWLSGACLAVRREAFAAIGGFDESFFMFMEDVDLCWRLGRAGWNVVYQPEARVVHVEGVSRAAAPYRMILEHHRSLWRYAARTTTGGRRLWLPAVAVGLVLRTGLMTTRRAVQRR
jgi:N-acetylglucosaminyl-diphospho-decaprenol L-rhamnosyltransferase